MLGQNVFNEVKVGYAFINNIRNPAIGVAEGPRISLRGYTIGEALRYPTVGAPDATSIRNDLTFALSAKGRHEFTIGGDFIYNLSHYKDLGHGRTGVINATGGAVPGNIQSLFPVWNNPSTWNIGALSPITISYLQTFGSFAFKNPKTIAAAWLQQNWAERRS